ncbi:hypothetical protein T261_0832 [Streptomyces lydicus]|nr:hypothetical protein T261_0832 [Streptomyces lydicus]
MALDLAGFTKDHEGVRHLAVRHPEVRERLTYLHQTARDWRVTVTTSERPYLGDVASVIAQGLPGRWEAEIEHYPEEQNPGALLDFLWDSGPYTANLENHRVPCAAILRDGAGTELLLLERPRDGHYLVAALLPDGDHVNVTAPGPRSIAEPNAHFAASAVSARLLPEYERALHLSRLREVEEDLRWAHETFEPGTVGMPYPQDLDAALDRFLTHAPHLIAASRRPGAKPMTPQETAVLDRFETVLDAVRSDATGARVGPVGEADAMSVWLSEGEDLIELVSAANPAATAESARPGVAAITPPKPPAAVGSTGLRR